jgi:hypothetical protein
MSLELPELLPFSVMGSPVGPLSTSLEYFYLFRKAQTNAILQEHRGQQEWEAAAWLLEKTLTTITTEEHIYGPFPLCHLDLHFKNILVDGDYNITGIIDWSNAQTVPIERFAINPEFIPPPAASVEFKEAILEFRGVFVDALEKVEREKEKSRSGKEIPLHRLFASPLRLSIAAPVAIRGGPFLMLNLFFPLYTVKALGGTTFRNSIMSVLHEAYQLPI